MFCLFATDFRNANEALSILINTMCHMEGEINETICLKMKCQILDLFIGIGNVSTVDFLDLEIL